MAHDFSLITTQRFHSTHPLPRLLTLDLSDCFGVKGQRTLLPAQPLSGGRFLINGQLSDPVSE